MGLRWDKSKDFFDLDKYEAGSWKMYLKNGRKTFFRLFLPDTKKILDDLPNWSTRCKTPLTAKKKQQNMKMYPQINTFLFSNHDYCVTNVRTEFQLTFKNIYTSYVLKGLTSILSNIKTWNHLLLNILSNISDI